MEAYLMISYLNDFIFCPRSIYFHQLYGRASTKLYHSSVQTKGLNAHKAVDNKAYSTAKNVLQGIEVYSDTYQLCGKIDTFDQQKGLLTERKKKITTIYDGYIYQLYAQYFCMVDMGYQVKQLRLYSMDDNKVYPVALPNENKKYYQGFMTLLEQIKAFNLNTPFRPNKNKCQNCIYSNLCDVSLC